MLQTFFTNFTAGKTVENTFCLSRADDAIVVVVVTLFDLRPSTIMVYEDYYSSDEEEHIKRKRQRNTMVASAAVLMCASTTTICLLDDDDGFFRNRVVEHRHNKRSKRRTFDPQRVYDSLQRSHLGPDALFGKEFHMYFRLSRPRVQVILEKLGNSDDPFYKSFRRDKYGRVGPSLEAKVLLPLRTVVYGVAPHCFCDVFEMSHTMARDCCKRFNKAMSDYSGDEFIDFLLQMI